MVSARGSRAATGHSLRAPVPPEAEPRCEATRAHPAGRRGRGRCRCHTSGSAPGLHRGAPGPSPTSFSSFSPHFSSFWFHEMSTSQPRNRPPPQSLEKCASRRGPGLGAALATAVARCPVTPPPRVRCRRRTCYPAPGCGVRSETTSFYRHLRGQSDVAGRLVPRFPDARLLSPTARNLALVTCDACTRWVRSGLKSLRIARRRARQEKPLGPHLWRVCAAPAGPPGIRPGRPAARVPCPRLWRSGRHV